MIVTNLIAGIVVTLVTNTTERFPQRLVPIPQSPNEIGFVNAIFYGKYENIPNPQEKWVKTRIIEVTSISLAFNGEGYIARNERLVSEEETRFVLSPPEPLKWINTSNTLVIK